jgi:hypothetical protein
MIGLEPASSAGRRRSTPSLSQRKAAVPAELPARTACPGVVIGRMAGRVVARSALGVALRCVPGPAASGRPVFQVVLTGEDREAGILYEAPDDSEVIAVWRRAAADLGLPLIIVTADGGLSVVSPQLGLLGIGTPRPRRRNAILSKRRPRMMLRRKAARFGDRIRVFREREIIART